MAEKLLLYYKYIRETEGIRGQIALATSTKMPSPKAALAPDSPENITLFKEAVKKLTNKPAPNY